MKMEKPLCPLIQYGSCLGELCPMWFKSNPYFNGCMIKAMLWSAGEVLTKSMVELSKSKQIDEVIYSESLPFPCLELDGEKFNVLIEDFSRIMEITERLRSCEHIEDLKKFAEEEANRTRRGIQIVN